MKRKFRTKVVELLLRHRKKKVMDVKYNWDKDASKYHIKLHRDTLIAAINYCDRRDLDDSCCGLDSVNDDGLCMFCGSENNL